MKHLIEVRGDALKYVATLGRVLLAGACVVVLSGVAGAVVLAVTGSKLVSTVVFMAVLLLPGFCLGRRGWEDRQDDVLDPTIQVGIGVVTLSVLVLVSLMEACA